MPFITKINGSGPTRLHVRAILAFMFSCGLIAGFFYGLITPNDYKEVAMITIVWYFSKRTAQEDDSTNGNGTT